MDQIRRPEERQTNRNRASHWTRAHPQRETPQGNLQVDPKFATAV
jgi:hypothetical protein